jgi:Zn-dependent oligopeptidase
MGLILDSDTSEKTRKSVIESYYALERHVLEKTDYLKLVKMRNQFARMRGFSDFYEMKVKQNEGISKEQLFAFLDNLKTKSLKPAKERLAELIAEKGESVLEPWNFNQATAGDLTQELDRYFPLSKTLSVWMRSMQNLGMKFNAATVHVDLLNRARKHQNGLMRGAFPGFVDRGKFRPA